MAGSDAHTERTGRLDGALLPRALQRAALLAFGMAAGAWFAAAACLVLWLDPSAIPVLRLAAFGLLNAAGALGFVALAMQDRPRPGSG